MKICNKTKGNNTVLNNNFMGTARRQSIPMPQEWKNYEKKNIVYQKLIKNIPPFTKIFK